MSYMLWVAQNQLPYLREKHLNSFAPALFSAASDPCGLMHDCNTWFLPPTCKDLPNYKSRPVKLMLHALGPSSGGGSCGAACVPFLLLEQPEDLQYAILTKTHL